MCLCLQGKGTSGSSDFAAMVQAMRVYVTVDSTSACPSDFLPVGISHYKTLNTVFPLLFAFEVDTLLQASESD